MKFIAFDWKYSKNQNDSNIYPSSCHLSGLEMQVLTKVVRHNQPIILSFSWTIRPGRTSSKSFKLTLLTGPFLSISLRSPKLQHKPLLNVFEFCKYLGGKNCDCDPKLNTDKFVDVSS